MAGSLANVLIIGTVIFAIAMIIPIFFDVDFPQKGETLTLIERALCTIIPNGGGNATCNIPDDIFYFNSTSPSLVITANYSQKTLFFELNSTGIDATSASNLGNGSEVFAQEVFDDLEFRTLTDDGSGITITQSASELDFSLNNILLDALEACGDDEIPQWQTGGSEWNCVAPSTVGSNITTIGGLTDVEDSCPDGQILRFNSGSGMWECQGTVQFAILTAGGATLQTPASSTPNRNTIAGTNFDYIVLEYDATTSEEAIWQFQFPTDADATADVNVLIRFLTPSGSVGGVCFSGQFLGRTNGETYDVAMGTTITGCNTTLDTAGDINQITLTFTSAQHGLAAGDTLIFKLARATANGSDTHTGDAQYVDSRVTWG